MDRHTCTDDAFKRLVDIWLLAMQHDGIEGLAAEIRRILANGGRIVTFTVSVRFV